MVKDKEKRYQKEELTFSRSEYQYCGLVGCAIVYLFIYLRALKLGQIM
jgi:hypothetical protein